MNNSTFNFPQFCLVIVLGIITSGLLVACGNLGASREIARRMQNSTQLRGIHQGLITYANYSSNWFPGINADGDHDGIEVEARFQTLMDGDFFTPEYAISPLENDPAILPWTGTSQVTSDNYSFAMLQVTDKNPADPNLKEGRRAEWGQTLNSFSIVVSDRNTGSVSTPTSVSSSSGWEGSVLWNDNHVGFEPTDTFQTQYAGGPQNNQDKLFESNGDFDALLIHTGN